MDEGKDHGEGLDLGLIQLLAAEAQLRVARVVVVIERSNLEGRSLVLVAIVLKYVLDGLRRPALCPLLLSNLLLAFQKGLNLLDFEHAEGYLALTGSIGEDFHGLEPEARRVQDPRVELLFDECRIFLELRMADGCVLVLTALTLFDVEFLLALHAVVRGVDRRPVIAPRLHGFEPVLGIHDGVEPKAEWLVRGAADQGLRDRETVDFPHEVDQV